MFEDICKLRTPKFAIFFSAPEVRIETTCGALCKQYRRGPDLRALFCKIITDLGLHSFTDAAWHTATLPFDRGGLGLTRATDLRVAAYLGSVFAASPELIDVMTPSSRFLSTYLMEPAVLDVSSSLPMGSTLPDPLHNLSHC